MGYYADLNKLIYEFKMCAEYANRGPEQRRCNQIIDQLNKIHKALTYEGIEEPEYTTVIEREYWANDPGCEVDQDVIQLYYDENGILRKKISMCHEIPLLDRYQIPEDHCLLDITLYDEKGEYVRNCGYPWAVNAEYLAIERLSIRDGQYCCETFRITEENLFSEESCYEPVKCTQGMNRWQATEFCTEEYRTLEWFCDAKNDDRVYFKSLRGLSYRVLGCDGKYNGQAWLPELGTCGRGLRWKQVDDVLYIQCEGAIEEQVFPWDEIHKVVIAPGCTEIGESVFEPAYPLWEIELPDGLLRIGARAFRDCCDRCEITLPDGLQEIGAEAFQYCNVELYIPDSVTEIGENAFYGVPHIIYNGPAQSDDDWGALSRN